MKYSAITGPIFEQHDKEGHVESQDRLLGIIDRLPEHVTRCDPVPAAPGDIERVHHPGYLKWLRQQCERNVEYDFVRDSVYIGGNFTQCSLFSGYIDENTYINPHSYEVATHAAGSAIAAVERTLDGESCFALVRPPGHHAASAWAMGFCLINNIAVAARYAQAELGIKRVAILDWDIHHGNGTEAIFWDDPSVLYVSLHAWPYYPGTGGPSPKTPSGEDVPGGENPTTLNIPLPGGTGDRSYLQAFEQIAYPAVEAFSPEIVLVSVGFDAHRDDPLSPTILTDRAFYQLASRTASLAPRVAAVLEGGYYLHSLPRLVEITVEGFNNPT